MFDAYIEAWELRELVLKKEVRPREVAEFFLARIERLNPKLGAFMTVAAERALADADAPGAGERRRRGRDAALWGRLLAQGPDLDARHPDHDGLEELRELPPARRRRVGGAPAQCGRNPARQNHHARTRRPSDHRGRPVPAGAQSVEPRIQRRRLQRRRRGAGRGRDGSAGRGHRRRRLDSRARGLLRRGGAEALARAYQLCPGDGRGMGRVRDRGTDRALGA